MPPKKNKQANEEKLKLGQQAKLEKEAVAESDTALNNLQSSFKESKAYTNLSNSLQNKSKSVQTSKTNSIHPRISSIHFMLKYCH